METWTRRGSSIDSTRGQSWRGLGEGHDGECLQTRQMRCLTTYLTLTLLSYCWRFLTMKWTRYSKDRPIKLHLNLKIHGTDFENDKDDMNSSLCFSEIEVVQCHKYKQSFKPKWNKVLSFFKRGASEAAEGCLASVAAKLVKTATKILTLILQYTCA